MSPMKHETLDITFTTPQDQAEYLGKLWADLHRNSHAKGQEPIPGALVVDFQEGVTVATLNEQDVTTDLFNGLGFLALSHEGDFLELPSPDQGVEISSTRDTAPVRLPIKNELEPEQLDQLKQYVGLYPGIVEFVGGSRPRGQSSPSNSLTR